MPYFATRTIAFLIDDFSVHRLPEDVQVILNRVVWERRSTHIFKLSAEKYGARLTDNFDATAELSRELTEIDCGNRQLQFDLIAAIKGRLILAIFQSFITGAFVAAPAIVGAILAGKDSPSAIMVMLVFGFIAGLIATFGIRKLP